MASLLLACSRDARQAAKPEEAPAVLTMVGANPRGYTRLPLNDPWIRRYMEPIVDVLPFAFGKFLEDCGSRLASSPRSGSQSASPSGWLRKLMG
jgi:hypothetical protein